MQDAAGKVQGAAQTQYETAKDTASNLANKAQGHAQDAHGQAKVRPCIFQPFLNTADQSCKPSAEACMGCGARCLGVLDHCQHLDSSRRSRKESMEIWQIMMGIVSLTLLVLGAQ